MSQSLKTEFDSETLARTSLRCKPYEFMPDMSKRLTKTVEWCQILFKSIPVENPDILMLSSAVHMSCCLSDSAKKIRT